MKKSLAQRLYIIIALLILINIVGSLGYVLIENWSFLDALYMTVITISTVGYTEVNPMSAGGKLWSMFVIFAGVGIVGYSFGVIVEFIIEGQFTGLIGGRRMKKSIEALSGHYIICGFGVVGQEISEELRKANSKFIVVEKDTDAIKKCQQRGFLYVEGDASDDKVLLEAGIERAYGLAAVTSSDATNIFITLTARGLNKSIFIISSANSPESEEKMFRAGANKSISPLIIGGRRIAALLLKPIVADYLDTLTKGGKIEYQLVQVPLPEKSPVIGKTVRESGIRRNTGSLVMGIKRATGEFITNPNADTLIEKGDVLIILGLLTQIEALKVYIEAPKG